MNNKEYIAELAQKTGYTQADTQKMVKAVVDKMLDVLIEEEAVSVAGFGTFEVKKRLERVVINPSTGQKMLVPPKLVLNFKPNAQIKEILKEGGNDNE
ncbi:putative DNA-binding protein HU [Prevotella sp. DNF00663]|uniref:HU family DNA-binding protein n=1 Tax=unclassified Prevotella TaxID=2638335 RepID=UPI000513D54B|nr:MULTISPECIES: HU family DNA-binding protein [unclassified Prevotella]KGI60555.1 DNA-binding protein [Prevotella sp. S7 MS 2]KXB85694.1 putative DNA-binding protein HU [Prevotella sp. DNF00663]